MNHHVVDLDPPGQVFSANNQVPRNHLLGLEKTTFWKVLASPFWTSGLSRPNSSRIVERERAYRRHPMADTEGDGRWDGTGQ